MDRLKRDLEHIKTEGVDSEALFKRTCKHLEELAHYKAAMPLEQAQELAKAERAGRLVVLPEVPEADRQAFEGGLHDYFQEAANYDPSVGIFGMREGEAKLANALMSALNRKETEGAAK